MKQKPAFSEYGMLHVEEQLLNPQIRAGMKAFDIFFVLKTQLIYDKKNTGLVKTDK